MISHILVHVRKHGAWLYDIFSEEWFAWSILIANAPLGLQLIYDNLLPSGRSQVADRNIRSVIDRRFSHSGAKAV